MMAFPAAPTEQTPIHNVTIKCLDRREIQIPITETTQVGELKRQLEELDIGAAAELKVLAAGAVLEDTYACADVEVVRSGGFLVVMRTRKRRTKERRIEAQVNHEKENMSSQKAKEKEIDILADLAKIEDIVSAQIRDRKEFLAAVNGLESDAFGQRVTNRIQRQAGTDADQLFENFLEDCKSQGSSNTKSSDIALQQPNCHGCDDEPEHGSLSSSPESICDLFDHCEKHTSPRTDPTEPRKQRFPPTTLTSHQRHNQATSTEKENIE